jgi:NitT/TauT family transport system permease protein
MKRLLIAFEPFKTVNKKTVLLIVGIEVLFCLVLWNTLGSQLIPSPIKVSKSILDIVSSKEFIDNLFSSLSLTLKGMFFSIVIALFFGYLVLIPAFKPITTFITKCRYLTLTGLIFLFTLLTQSGHQLKLSLLIFGIVPFFVTSLVSIFNSINTQEYDLCKTLRMNSWQTMWEVVILGRLDQVFEVMRQNFAISWMMITMVEGLSMSEGGLGTMLIKSNKYIDLGKVFGILFIILALGILFDFLLGKMRVWLFPYAKL